MILRSFQHGDERIFIKLINTTYRNLETLTIERASAVLYVKSGGRIEAEYLHLVREFGKTA
jgi:hypothetical protein